MNRRSRPPFPARRQVTISEGNVLSYGLGLRSRTVTGPATERREPRTLESPRASWARLGNRRDLDPAVNWRLPPWERGPRPGPRGPWPARTDGGSLGGFRRKIRRRRRPG